MLPTSHLDCWKDYVREVVVGCMAILPGRYVLMAWLDDLPMIGDCSHKLQEKFFLLIRLYFVVFKTIIYLLLLFSLIKINVNIHS